MSLSKAIICDLDGTLCDHSHRLRHILRDKYFIAKDANSNELIAATPPGWKPDYKRFYDEMGEDKVNEWCSNIIRTIDLDYDGKILFVTGRPEKYRKETWSWLMDVPFYKYGGKSGQEENFKLFMRPDYLPCNRIDTIDPVTGEKSVFYPRLEDIKPDKRPTHEVKREIYENEIKGKYDVLFCIDDDPRCVQTYRDLGLVCLDVGQK